MLLARFGLISRPSYDGPLDAHDREHAIAKYRWRIAVTRELLVATQRMTFKQWQEKLGKSMSIQVVPDALNLQPHEVGRLIKQGHLPLHTFRADDGRVYRMVRSRDVRMLAMVLRPPAIRDMARALHTLMNDKPTETRSLRRRRAA